VAKMLHAMPLMNLPKNHMTCLPGMTKNSMKMAQMETMQAKRRQPRRLQVSSLSARASARVVDVPETFA
jgi:hypothetical protein